MKVRKTSQIEEIPPDYGPHSGRCTLCLYYGGQMDSDLGRWVGGNVLKVDYCEISTITLGWLYSNNLFRTKLRDAVLYGRKSELEFFSVILKDSTLQELVDYDELKVYAVDRSVAKELGFVEQEVEEEELDPEQVKKHRSRKGKGVVVEEENSDSIFGSDGEYDDDFGSDSSVDGGDDTLYHKYTDVGEEWIGDEDNGGAGEEAVDSDGDQDLLLSDDDFPTFVDGGEEEQRAPIYVRSQNNSPSFELGMIFSRKKDFRDLVDAHSIIEGKNIYYTKSDKTRVYARCQAEGCNFKINLRKMGTDTSFEITTLYAEHTCIREYNVKNMNSNWLCERYGYQWKDDKDRSVEGFRKTMINETKCHVTWWQAYLCRRKALMSEKTDVAGEYALLCNYANEIRRTNPGSTVLLGVDPVGDQNMFSRFYICLNSLKQGFLRGCRPLFGVDGTFCKGPYGGILLTAVGVDGNNNILPIAWAVVRKEDGDNWDWFLRNLKDDLGIVRDFEWTIISDKQKGLIKAVIEVFPGAAHRFCVSHMHSNFMTAGFRGHGFKVALWRAAKATTVNEFGRRMLEMKNLDVKAYQWLKDKRPEQWSRSHFNTTPKCDMLVNNICESFNAIILEARELPILRMLEKIMEEVNTRVVQCRRKGDHWKGPFCPRIRKVIEVNTSKLPDCQPFKSSNIHYEVRCIDGTQYAVDLDKMTCGCRKWDLTGIPCKHAISAINCQKLKIEPFVHKWYRVETYREVYRMPIIPMNGRAEWPISDSIPPLPPKLIRQVGRPPKARRREPDEDVPKRRRKAAGRPPHLEAHTKKRNQQSLTCGRCGERGHNRRSCLRKDGEQDGRGEEEAYDLGGAENEYHPRASQLDEGIGSQMRSQVTQETAVLLDEDMDIDDDYLMEIEEIIRNHCVSQPAPQSSSKAASVPITQSASQPVLAKDRHSRPDGVVFKTPATLIGSPPGLGFRRQFKPPRENNGPTAMEGGSREENGDGKGKGSSRVFNKGKAKKK